MILGIQATQSEAWLVSICLQEQFYPMVGNVDRNPRSKQSQISSKERGYFNVIEPRPVTAPDESAEFRESVYSVTDKGKKANTAPM